eukprot:1152603-Pelagomonas_calceolata.AAC.1
MCQFHKSPWWRVAQDTQSLYVQELGVLNSFQTQHIAGPVSACGGGCCVRSGVHLRGLLLLLPGGQRGCNPSAALHSGKVARYCATVARS